MVCVWRMMNMFKMLWQKWWKEFNVQPNYGNIFRHSSNITRSYMIRNVEKKCVCEVFMMAYIIDRVCNFVNVTHSHLLEFVLAICFIVLLASLLYHLINHTIYGYSVNPVDSHQKSISWIFFSLFFLFSCLHSFWLFEWYCFTKNCQDFLDFCFV